MKTLRTFATVCAAAWSLHAYAQATPAPTSAAPSEGTKPEFQSAFADYRVYQDITPGDWRRINDSAHEAIAKGGSSRGQMAPATPAATPHHMGGAEP